MDILLLVSSLFLAASIAGAFLPRLTRLRFQLDLYQILLSLRSEVEKLGALSDPAYLEESELIGNVAELVKDIGREAIVAVIRRTEGRQAEETIRSTRPEVQAAVDRAHGAFAYRLRQYLFREIRIPPHRTSPDEWKISGNVTERSALALAPFSKGRFVHS